MGRFQRFTESLVRRGIGPETPRDEIKNIVVLNTLVILVSITQLSTLPLILYYYDAGGPPFLAATLLMLALQIVVFTLAGFGKHRLARITFAFSGINNITVFTLLAGTGSYVQFLMPAVSVGAFYYFAYADRAYMYAMVALSTVALFGLEVWSNLSSPLTPLPEEVLSIARYFVLFWFSVITFGFLYYGYVTYRRAETELAIEQAKSDSLLLNILPPTIAQRLKERTGIIADRFAEVTILFADLVNFTQLSERTPPAELVQMLDRIFSEFDSLVATLGLEKIKTIGDAYMVAAGIPEPREDHARVMADLALAMQEAVHNMDIAGGVSLRIGIHSGPVVAGVIGHKKFAYDLWGDSVNTASRMESQGEPKRIQVTQAVRDALSEIYTFEERGEIVVKGKGAMMTYFLTGRAGD